MSLYRLIQGDSFKILPQLEDNSVDVVITDPDYGVGINYEKTHGTNADSVARKPKETVLYEIIELIMHSYRIAKRDIVIFWSGSIEKIHEFVDIVESLPFNLRYMGIWYKPNGAGPTGNGLGRRFEVWFWIDGKEKREGEWKFLPDVLVHNRITKKSKEGLLHPTQKPVELMERLIKFFTKQDDIVLDPFLGSGTTMYACQNLQRSCIGIEINPIFNEMTKTRCFPRRFLDRKANYEFLEL